MKFVLDENVSGGVAHAIAELGHTVLIAGKDTPSGGPDQDVFQFILGEGAALITRDHHFTNPVRFDSEKTQGILYIRRGNLTSVQEISLVCGFVKRHGPEEYKGKLVTLYLDTTTIR